MKYCKYCTYASFFEYEKCVYQFVKEGVSEYIDHDEFVTKSQEKLNEKGTCQYYKRKWYLFWIKE